MPAGNRRPLYSRDEVPAAASSAAQQEAPLSSEGAAAAISTPAQTLGDAPFKQPCTLKGLSSAAYAGALGYFLGFVPAIIKFKGRQWGMIHKQGVASASQLALMSGMYTAVHCICQRIRMVEDGWNRGIAGCSTGLVLGWKAGPWSALQSCVGIGLISALIDFGGGAVEAAEASMLCQLQELQQQQREEQQHQQQVWGDALWQLQRAAAPLTACVNGTLQHLEQRQLQFMRPNSRAAAAAPAAAAAASGESSAKQRHWQHEQQQQQLLVTSALDSLHAAAGAAQQLLAAPPLMFLGACCSTSSMGGAAVAGPSATAVVAPVNACELKPAPSSRHNR